MKVMQGMRDCMQTLKEATLEKGAEVVVVVLCVYVFPNGIFQQLKIYNATNY